MLDTQWVQYKALMRQKHKGKPDELEKLERCFIWFENQPGKIEQLLKVARQVGNRLSSKQKEKLKTEIQEQMQKSMEKEAKDGEPTICPANQA